MSALRYQFQIVTGLLMTALMGGCASQMKAWEPGSVSTRGAYEMLQLDGEGLEKEREVVYGALKSQIDNSPHYKIIDFTKSGVFLDFHENGVWVRNEELPLTRDQVYLQIDVVDWRVKTEPNENTVNQEQQYIGVVGITATVVDTEGRILLDEKPYTAQAKSEKEQDLNKVRAMAAQRAVTLFVQDLQPVVVDRQIDFDRTHADHAEAIAFAEKGELQVAGVLFRNHWQQNPDNPVCIYNLAVIRDLLGDPEEALFLLDGLSGKYRKNEIATYRKNLRAQLGQRTPASQK